MSRHEHSVSDLDQTLTGHSRWDQARILLGRNLPRKQFRQLQEAQLCSVLAWFASTDVSHEPPPEHGITCGEHSIWSRDSTILPMTLGSELTATGSWVREHNHALVASWLLHASTRWWLCVPILAPLNVQTFLRTACVCSWEVWGLKWM